jgi:hypothetical protein
MMFFNNKRSSVVDVHLREGDRPGEIIADTENWLEQILGGIAGIGCVFIILPLFAGVFDLLVNSAQLLQSKPGWLAASLGVGVVLVWIGYQLRSQVDFYHIIDMEGKKVEVYERLLNSESRKPVCNFSEIHGLATDSRRIRRSEKNKSRTKRWDEWHYGLVLILNTGKKLKIIDHHHVDFKEMQSRGEQLAQKMKLEFYSEPEKFLRLQNGPSGPEVWWTDETSIFHLISSWIAR